MREDICSIPIHDVFGPRDGCPICRMRDMLEDRIATYITGAAMMEPDVRVETNRLGFCKDHFNMILSIGNRLSIALIPETHLRELDEKLIYPSGDKIPAKKLVPSLKSAQDSCFMCENIQKNIRHLMETVIAMWEKDADFRSLYESQPYICFPHYQTVLQAAEKMGRKNYQQFVGVTRSLTGKYLRELEKDVTHFCRMFDYRNKDADWGNSKDSIERAIHYITGREPQNTGKADEKNR